MGGHATYFGPAQIGALDGSREPVKDISNVMYVRETLEDIASGS